MSVKRANVEKAKEFIRARLGNPYVYGGMFTEDVDDGTDCSGVWNDTLGLVTGKFKWGRESEGATTESYRYIPVGGVGPFGTIAVARPQDIPSNAVAKLAFHHGPGGGANSHMWGELDGMLIESAGSKGLVTQPSAWPINHSYANAWAYLPGPIVDDGTPVTVVEPSDTLFADVSEWQVPVNDSYPYKVISIRSNDGNHRDKNWAKNYAWCKKAADDGRLTCFIVYYYWRPGVDSVAVLQDMVGVPHPKMAVMIDVESGGNPRGDFSDKLNAEDARLASWLGSERRVIAYGNMGDLNALWPNRREDQFIIAAYGSNPGFPGKIAHQYTDGQGYGGGLPEGCPPFGNCDMNSADGYTPSQFAAALGISVGVDVGDELVTITIPRSEWDDFKRKLDAVHVEQTQWHESLSPYRPDNEGKIGTWCRVSRNDDSMLHMMFTELSALDGDLEDIGRVIRGARGQCADKSERFKARCARVARRIPTEYVQAWKAAGND